MMSVTVAADTTSAAVGSCLSRSRRRCLTVALRSKVSVTPTRILTKLKHECATPLPLLQQVANNMSSDMRAGLAAEAGPGPGLPMIPSYVENLPTGYVLFPSQLSLLLLCSTMLMIYYCCDMTWLRNEKGLFYALDLGGTNFRVLRVQLGGKDERVIATEFDQVSIPHQLMFATSQVTHLF